MLNILFISEIQTKSTTRYHFTVTKAAIIKKTENKKCGKDVEKLVMECKMATLLWKQLGNSGKQKLNMELPCDEQFYLWVYPKGIGNGYSNEYCYTNIP